MLVPPVTENRTTLKMSRGIEPMPTVKIHFPAGRYHATPLGSHVNEGQVEWPPSPWRLLRALIACGYNTQQWVELPEVARSLFENLSHCLPSYRLPAASVAHSRHYMPIGMLDKGREKTTLVFDTWANVSHEDLLIHWDCKLEADETELLQRLLGCLGYLGRSESWIEAELIDDSTIKTIQFNAFPCSNAHPPGRGWEQVTMMAATDCGDYKSWRTEIINRLLSEYPLPEGKKKPTAKLLNDRARMVAPYPTDIVDCLQKDTAWWKQHRWSQPLGSQRIVYWRRCDSLEVGVPQRSLRSSVRPVTTMLLAITTPSGKTCALPSVTRTLPQAELLHRAIVGRVAKGRRVYCPELTGKDVNERPLMEGHRHAHILPVDLDSDGHLDHIIIHAPMGLGGAAQQSIATLRRTWTKGGAGDMQLALAGSGGLDSLRSLPDPLLQQIIRLLGPVGGAKTWVSSTPFVPPRFLKSQGRNSLVEQIASELQSRGVQATAFIQVLEWSNDTLPMRHFVRVRRKTPPPLNVCYAIRLEFAEPQFGPISLGYGSHFGLGMFGAVE